MSHSREREPGTGILGRNAATSLARREVLSPRRDRRGPGLRKGIVQLEGKDAESENVSIVLAPIVDPLAPVIHGPCYAIVEWGTGSGNAVAEVDFAKGTVLHVAGSFIAVVGRNDGNDVDGGSVPDGETTRPSTIDDAPGDQMVAVIVSGYGDRPAAGRATRTFYRRGLLVGSSVTIPAPNFARSFTVTRTPVATTSIGVDIADGPGGAPLREGRYAFGSGIIVPQLGLYGMAGAVVLTNTGAVTIDRMQVVFELAL